MEHQEDYPRNRSSYRFLYQLSEGDRAVVFKAVCIPLYSVVAIKIIDLYISGNRQIDTLSVESKNKGLPYEPNIVKSHCCFIHEAQLWVVMPYVAGGSLQSLISYAFPYGLPLKCIQMILYQILTAMACIHAQGNHHRGVKPGNILVNFNGFVALSDFGVSTWNYGAESPGYWVAPEVIASELGFTMRSDIWSFGVTALELFYGIPPIFYQIPEMKRAILKRFHYSDHYAKGEGRRYKILTESLASMIDWCLEVDPLKRPSADELFYHPLFKNCKGMGYLVRNLLQGLPEVEQRFKDPKIQKSLYLNKFCRTSSPDSGDDVNPRRVLGWVFTNEWIRMKPVFLPDKSDMSSEPALDPVPAIPVTRVIGSDLQSDYDLAVEALMIIEDEDFDEQLSEFDARMVAIMNFIDEETRD